MDTPDSDHLQGMQSSNIHDWSRLRSPFAAGSAVLLSFSRAPKFCRRIFAAVRLLGPTRFRIEILGIV
jgi:hypothetical protein